MANPQRMPYETVDGGKWLGKALDPVNVMNDVVGMPDTTTNNVAVLNYQMQSECPIPNTYGLDTAAFNSYDSDLYVFQHPIMMASAMSYPASTVNPKESPFVVHFGGTGFKPKIVFNSTAQVFPRTVKQILNDQIEGATLQLKQQTIATQMQRYRVIYGACQVIPACAQLYDSGTIEACQQIFNSQVINKICYTAPTGTTDGTARTELTEIFQQDDFPDSTDTIQNPNALYCRYREGSFMPYKLRNPLFHPYHSVEQLQLTSCDYVVCGASYRVGDAGPLVNMTWDNASKSFVPVSTDATTFAKHLYLHCFTKTGIEFFYQFMTTTASSASDQISNAVTLPQNHSPAYNTAFYALTGSVATITARTVSTRSVDAEEIAAANNNMILPFGTENLGNFAFKNVSLSAGIKLLFRQGLEILLTAGGVYTMFKHRSPPYDERAIKSYIRCIRLMRDAFYGNAASDSGHQEYQTYVTTLAWTDPDVGLITNNGARWMGSVKVA